jgi:hypothetical protein
LSGLLLYLNPIFRGLFIALMMEAECTSEMSVSFYQITQRNIPEDSHLQICRRENLKCHQDFYFQQNPGKH